MQELIAETSTSAKDRIDLVQIDTSDDKSVQDAAAKLSDQPSLYGVVNNAGIGWGHSLQDTIETNYFGVRRVCSSLTPHLQNPGGRIVNIASASGPMYVSKCNDNELKSKFEHPLTTTLAELDKIAKRYQESKTYDDGEAYGFSKALVNAFTVLYAKEHPSLIVNSCTPGYIKTDLTAGSGATNLPEVGAICPVYLLMSSEIEKLPTGRYYGSDAVRSPFDKYRGPGDPPFVE